MKVLRIILIGILTFALVSGVNQYLFCPEFDFPTPAAFSGDSIYNPYQTMDPDHWVKCNFHAHARAWNGITNGYGTARQVHDAYQALSYGIHCISNYQSVDTTNSGGDSYIPAYEHGYNIQKTHQLVLGDHHVEWLDYLLPQTADNKQDILNHLKNPNSLVILNHPALRNGYPVSNLSKLTNYDCMEVLNPSAVSTSQWDAALSAGRKVFIVGNDDLHNVTDRDRLGKMCTFINVTNKKQKSVLDALKTGNSFGVMIGKEQKIDSIPFLTGFRVKGNTVSIAISQPAVEVVVTGQEGKVIRTFHKTKEVSFTLTPRDHYARTTFSFENGTRIFLNPVFFTNASDSILPVVHENFLKTMLCRTAGVMIIFLYLLIIGKSFFLRKASGHLVW